MMIEEETSYVDKIKNLLDENMKRNDFSNQEKQICAEIMMSMIELSNKLGREMTIDLPYKGDYKVDMNHMDEEIYKISSLLMETLICLTNTFETLELYKKKEWNNIMKEIFYFMNI